jgi:hypothetical protein
VCEGLLRRGDSGVCRDLIDSSLVVVVVVVVVVDAAGLVVAACLSNVVSGRI